MPLSRHESRSLPARSDTRPRASAGAALTPPRYGIELADRQARGEPLPGGLRVQMERSFGTDLSSVRVHRDADTASLGAKAYASGTHLHFGPGQYAPQTRLGQARIGHEIAHTIQQSGGVTRATQTAGGRAVDGSRSLERQANIAGARAALGLPAGVSGSVSRGSGAVVQREVEGNTLQEFLDWQVDLQAKVEENPAAYQYLYTTVGFEHEFAQMRNGPLQGLDHLELAHSTAPRFPHHIPFILETDAGNSVELVSPPLLMPTKSSGTFTARSKRKPVPIAEDVEKVDGLYRQALRHATRRNVEMVDNPKRPGLKMREESYKSMRQLVGTLGNTTGITFALGNVDVQTHQISPATPNAFGANNATIQGNAIEGVQVGPSTKGHEHGEGQIITQVNFATTGKIADQLQRAADADASLRSGSDPDLVGVFRTAEDTIRRTLVGNTRPSNKLRRFYNALARALSGQMAVPYMNYFRTAQEQAFQNGQRMSQLNLPAGALDVAELISSRLKDTSSIWVKDMVVNLGLERLSRAEWQTVRARLSDEGVVAAIKQATMVDLTDRWPQNLRQGTRVQIGQEVDAAIARVLQIVEQDIQPDVADGFDARVGGLHLGRPANENRLEFGQHNRRDVGPRQDTYIRSESAQSDLWDRRLHVVETRGDGLAAQLDLLRRVGG